MDAYDGTTTEQQVESLRKTLYLTQNTPISQRN